MSPRWRGTSDTETVLAVLKLSDLRVVAKFIGMFAFIWDAKRKKLFLARDRMEKILYYGQNGPILVFIPVEALRAHPSLTMYQP